MSEGGQGSGPKLLAWGVHAFTASGAAFAFLAILATTSGAYVAAWIYLSIALLVDGVDETLARAARVRERLPDFDGETLDLVVDYLTYVLVPVMLVYELEMLPASFLVPGCIAILMASLYTFCNRQLKTPDNFFNGFPALWNVVVFHFFIFSTDALVNLAVVCLFLVLTFVPVKTVHPIRVAKWRPVTVAILMLWAGAAMVMLISYPGWPFLSGVMVIASMGYFIAISVWRSLDPAPFG